MSRKHLKREPHRAKDGAAWWYEQNDGVCVCIEFENVAGHYVLTHTIQWRAIRAALARKDRKP